MKLYYTDDNDGGGRVWFPSKLSAEKARRLAYAEHPHLKDECKAVGEDVIQIRSVEFKNNKEGILAFLNVYATNGDETIPSYVDKP